MMARTSENPDRNFSADGDAEKKDFEALRDTLNHPEPALPFSEAAQARVGKMIRDAASGVRAPVRLLRGKRDRKL
jgi:hypothetical protein